MTIRNIAPLTYIRGDKGLSHADQELQSEDGGVLCSPIHRHNIRGITAAPERHSEPPKPQPFVAGIEVSVLTVDLGCRMRRRSQTNQPQAGLHIASSVACVSQGVGEVVTSSGAFRKGQTVAAVPWPSGTWQWYIMLPEKTLLNPPALLP